VILIFCLLENNKDDLSPNVTLQDEHERMEGDFKNEAGPKFEEISPRSPVRISPVDNAMSLLDEVSLDTFMSKK